jgi:hypothetical protein
VVSRNVLRSVLCDMSIYLKSSKISQKSLFNMLCGLRGKVLWSGINVQWSTETFCGRQKCTVHIQYFASVRTKHSFTSACMTRILASIRIDLDQVQVNLTNTSCTTYKCRKMKIESIFFIFSRSASRAPLLVHFH